MQAKEIGLKITEDSCIHVYSSGDSTITINWNKKTKTDRVETFIKLSEAAAIQTANAIFSFFSKEPEASA